MTSIGELNRRITIEKKTRAADGGGGSNSTWSTFATVWARVKPMGGREIISADGKSHRLTHKVTVRFRTDITTDMRVKYNGAVMDILSSQDEDDARRWLVLNCEEGSPS